MPINKPLTRFRRLFILPGLTRFTADSYHRLAETFDLPILCGCFDPSQKFNAESLVLMDMACAPAAPGQHLDMLKELRIIAPDVCVALINVNPADDLEKYIRQPIIKGLFFEHCKPAHLEQGILILDQGGFWFPRKAVDILAAMRCELRTAGLLTSYDLTRREQQILLLLPKGLRDKQIASKLNLSPHTVKTHKNNLYRKLGVNSRDEAVNWMSSTTAVD